MKYNRNLEDVQDNSIVRAYGRDYGVSKVERYKWALLGKQGKMTIIDKNLLKIDLTYQRELKGKSMVLSIARNFDWALFGVLVVSETSDGFCVIDGGHRLRAAMLRDDVQNVPCIVFPMDSLSEEAQKFYGINNNRKVVTAYERHKAGLIAGHEVSVKADAMVRKYGYEIVGAAPGPYQTSAIKTIYSVIENNATIAENTFSILAKVAQGYPIRNEEIKGLFYLMKTNVGIDFFSFPLKNMIDAGIEKIHEDIKRMLIFKGKGNNINMADGMLNIINKGQSKNRVIVL